MILEEKIVSENLFKPCSYETKDLSEICMLKVFQGLLSVKYVISM